jgi:predicted outer membrane repeat protein
MDPTRFGSLVRALGRPASRRAAVTVLLAGAAVQLLPNRAAAAKRRGGNDNGAGRQQQRNGRPAPPRRAEPPGVADDACDVCASGCRFASLQPAIKAATAGDTIRICAGVYVAQRPTSVTKALTLVGAGADATTLTTAGNGRVLDIASLKLGMLVTLRDLTVSGGAEPNPNRGGGGGILVDKATLVLQGCRVVNNTAAPQGGGIRLGPNSALTLSASEVLDNAANAGGGISVGPGATVTLEAGGRVANNRSKIYGGGIDTGGTLILKAGSSVTGNTAGHQGGGINAGPGTVTVERGSHVSGNTAGKEGGGLFSITSNSTVSIADPSIVTGNAPDNCGGKAVENCVD